MARTGHVRHLEPGGKPEPARDTLCTNPVR
jgi:hypothetical protein